MKKHVYICLGLFLAACGGSGGGSKNETVNEPSVEIPQQADKEVEDVIDDSKVDEIVDDSPAGIWQGTGITSDGTAGEVVALIASNGKAFFVTDLPAVTVGDVSVSGSRLSFIGTGYDRDTSYEISMSGEVVSGARIIVSYSSPNENGIMEFSTADSAVTAYDRPSSLEKLEGVWNDEVMDNEGTWVFTIEGNGEFSAVRVPGNCSMDGVFSILDSTKNEYSVAATVSSCGDFNGAYSGLAFTSDENTFTDNVINFVVSSSHSAVVLAPVEQ